jgi:hypothetical protein
MTPYRMNANVNSSTKGTKFTKLMNKTFVFLRELRRQHNFA